MTISQELENLEGDNQFENIITVTDVPKGKFLVIRDIRAPIPSED